MFRMYASFGSRSAVLLIAVVLLGLPSSLRAFDQPPNIVLPGSDDQGYRDLGCFGSDVMIGRRESEIGNE